MFTGIIQGTGRVTRISKGARDGSAARMTVDLGKHARGLKKGQSVALNGVCLTAVRITGTGCAFEMVSETLEKTGLGALQKGSIVNIERSLKAGGRLEGHFVLGHVDGVGTIRRIEERPGETKVWFMVPKALAKYMVKKGSVAIDGISLTVTDVRGTTVSVSLIPHTIKSTNFRAMAVGDKINIETDILGKYIIR